MMKTEITALIALVAIVCSTPAFAQQPAGSEKLAFRKWDVGGSLGIFGTSRRDFGNSPTIYDNDPGLAWNIDVGRYFTSHLKAEGGLMWTNERSLWTPPVTSGGQIVGYGWRTLHPTSFSGALTYQFLENVFAHPYVSAGVRVTSLQEDLQTYRYTPNPGLPLTTTTQRRFAEARPFVAAGYKSYFNERAYMRSDLLLALGSHGISHGTVRVGFGVDF